MPIIPVRRPWIGNEPPRPPFHPNFSHPLSDGLRFFFPFSEGAGLGQDLTQQYTLTPDPSDDGWAPDGFSGSTARNFAASGSLRTVEDFAFQPSDVFSVAGWVRIAAATTAEGIFVQRYQLSTRYFRVLYSAFVVHNHSVQVVINYGTQVGINGTTDLRDNRLHHWCYVHAASNDHKLYIDGALHGSSTTDNGSNSSSNTIKTYFGSDRGTGTFLNGQLRWVGWWSKALTAAQVHELYDAPSRWGLVVPRRTFVVVPAAGGPVITSIDTDNIVPAGQTGVVVAGSGFGATQ